MDQELQREAQRRSYRMCGIGFSIYAFSLVLSSLVSVGMLYLLLNGKNPDVGKILGIDHFAFHFATFRVWTRFVASIFLCAAFTDAGWRRRTGLLILFSLADIILWALDNGIALGLSNNPAGHDAVRHGLYMTLVWAKFSLIPGLAGDFAQHVGDVKSNDFAKAACGTAMTGAVLWFFFFLEQIEWSRGWPLRQRPWTRQMMLFELGSWLMVSICLVQASLLCLRAGRSASKALREMAQEDKQVDPWGREA